MTATLPGSGEGRPQAGYLRTNRDRSPQRQQIRAAVVEAALRLFLDRGHLAVRVEDIAAEVGISRATFYKYFAERDEILAELFAQLLTTDVDPPQGGSSLERIQDLLVAAAQQMTKWEDLARFVYSIPLRHDAVLPGGPGEPAVMTTVQRLVQEGVAGGELRSDVPADVLSRHLAGSFEAAMREWATRQVDDAPERVRLLLDVAIGGLRPSN
jgi:AcrR family transcriptional regulator